MKIKRKEGLYYDEQVKDAKRAKGVNSAAT
jgi:hypothetical protein